MVISGKKYMLIDALKLQKRTFFQQEAVFSIVGKKRQKKGTNSESKQNSGSSVER